MPPMQGAMVRSLVGELRAHISMTKSLCATTKQFACHNKDERSCIKNQGFFPADLSYTNGLGDLHHLLARGLLTFYSRLGASLCGLHVPSGFDGSPGSEMSGCYIFSWGCVGRCHLGRDGVRGARAGARLGLMVFAALWGGGRRAWGVREGPWGGWVSPGCDGSLPFAWEFVGPVGFEWYFWDGSEFSLWQEARQGPDLVLLLPLCMAHVQWQWQSLPWPTAGPGPKLALFLLYHDNSTLWFSRSSPEQGRPEEGLVWAQNYVTYTSKAILFSKNTQKARKSI